MRISFVLIALAMALVSCSKAKTPQVQTPDVKVLTSEAHAKTATDFKAYWYRGLAEVNRFDVQQSRYGELHDGESIMIFVTEDFLKDKQVKYEFGDKTNAVPILKMNHHRRFYTGVYPYNILTSVFLPLDQPDPLKLSFSAMEWCGQAYAQFNRTESGFHVSSHSYFQAEADQEFDLHGGVIEDGLWPQLRKNPAKLPIGDFQAIPSVQFLRLMHKETKAYRASGEIKTNVDWTGWATPLSSYAVNYPELDRKLTIYFEPQFPYRIVGFEDTYLPMFSPSGGEAAPMTTRGVLTKSIMLDYWSRHGNQDSVYRKALGLSI